MMVNEIFVLIACHNRVEQTLHLLSCLRKQEPGGYRLNIILFDDGSTDGTAEMAMAQNPGIEVLRGDGTAYWATSMAAAEKYVVDRYAPTQGYFLWLNDDVLLFPRAIKSALSTAAKDPEALVVGSMQDPDTGKTSYSGFMRYGRHPLHLAKIDPVDVELPVQSINGNFVLIPVSTARQLGGIDGAFSHSWADIDYGLRATKMGIRILLMPGYVGYCKANPIKRDQSIVKAWRSFLGPKGAGNAPSLFRILRRHGGLAAPFYFLTTYVLWMLRALRAR